MGVYLTRDVQLLESLPGEDAVMAAVESGCSPRTMRTPTPSSSDAVRPRLRDCSRGKVGRGSESNALACQ